MIETWVVIAGHSMSQRHGGTYQESSVAIVGLLTIRKLSKNLTQEGEQLSNSIPRNILHLALVVFSILDLAARGGNDETGTVMYMTLGCDGTS